MNDRAWEKLAQGDRLLLYGLLDQAERVYAELLADVPTSSEAAFGLARVALERSDEQRGLEYATTALRLNPRNEDAERLVHRLTEIAGARREPAPAEHRPPPVRPSERAALARNPSMADHREQERKRSGQ